MMWCCRCKKSVTDLTCHYLGEGGVKKLRWFQNFQLERITNITGAKVVPTRRTPLPRIWVWNRIYTNANIMRTKTGHSLITTIIQRVQQCYLDVRPKKFYLKCSELLDDSLKGAKISSNSQRSFPAVAAQRFLLQQIWKRKYKHWIPLNILNTRFRLLPLKLFHELWCKIAVLRPFALLQSSDCHILPQRN
jgi:hypothetical protein